jgi:hypothetical protein
MAYGTEEGLLLKINQSDFLRGLAYLVKVSSISLNGEPITDIDDPTLVA